MTRTRKSQGLCLQSTSSADCNGALLLIFYDVTVFVASLSLCNNITQHKIMHMPIRTHTRDAPGLGSVEGGEDG